jgi:hypothetical protein
MTNKEMFDLIMQRLGNRTSTNTRAVVVKELNEIIRQMEQGDVLPWFMEDVWVESTIANQDYLDLPSDYIRDDDEGNAEFGFTTGYKKAPKDGYNQLRACYANSQASVPIKFAVYGEKVYFGPTPDGSYTFRLPYFKRTGEVVDTTSTITNKWLLNFFNFVTLCTINIVARTHTRDDKLVNGTNSPLADARKLMWQAIEARAHAGREYLLDNVED